MAKFVDITCIFFHTHSPYFMRHCTEYKLSALQVRISEEHKLNTTTQEFITGEVWLRVENRGIKDIHHCVRAIYNCKMRLHECLVQYEKSSIGVRLDCLAHTPVCKIESC